MKIRQKFLCFLVVILGILFVGIGKVQAASLTLSPSSGVVGTQVAISGREFTPFLHSVMAQWDSDPIDISDNHFDGDSRYISSTVQVPANASVGQHKITITVSTGALMYGPKHHWFSYFFSRALAADGNSAEAFFTVTAPPVTPPPVTPPAETPVADTNTTPANSTTKNTAPPPANSNQATAEPVAPTATTVTPDPIVQTESNKEVKKEAKVCYFPWWLWLVLILITAVNLALFWSRYWKKKTKQSES